MLSCAVVLLTRSYVVIDANLRVAHQYVRSTALARSRTRSYDLRPRSRLHHFLSRLRRPDVGPSPHLPPFKASEIPLMSLQQSLLPMHQHDLPKKSRAMVPPHAALQGSAAADVSERAAGTAHRRHRVRVLELCNSF